jgi:hypothetical protein
LTQKWARPGKATVVDRSAAAYRRVMVDAG